MARAKARQLPKETTSELVDHVLELQSDQIHPWDREWGNFLGDARIAGDVSDEQWKEFLVMDMLRYKFHCAREVTHKGGLIYSVSYDYGKAAGFVQYHTREFEVWESAVVSSKPNAAPSFAEGTLAWLGPGGMGDTITDANNAAFAAFKPGDHVLTVRHIIDVYDTRSGEDVSGRKIQPLFRQEITFEAHFKLLPDGAEFSPPALVKDPSKRPAVEKCLHVYHVITS